MFIWGSQADVVRVCVVCQIERRQELLRKRNQRLKIGLEEDELPREQQLDYIRCGGRGHFLLHFCCPPSSFSSSTALAPLSASAILR